MKKADDYFTKSVEKECMLFQENDVHSFSLYRVRVSKVKFFKHLSNCAMKGYDLQMVFVSDNTADANCNFNIFLIMNWAKKGKIAKKTQ